MYKRTFDEAIKKGLVNLKARKKEKDEIYEILNQAQIDIAEFYNIGLTIKECTEESTISILKNDSYILVIDMDDKYIYSHIGKKKIWKYTTKINIINALNDTFKSFDFVKIMKNVDL